MTATTTSTPAPSILAAELERRSVGHPGWQDGATRLVVVDGTVDLERSSGLASLTSSTIEAPGVVVIAATDDHVELHVAHVHTPRASTSHARLRVEVPPGRALDVVETHWSLPGSGETDAATEITVGDGGRLHHVRVIDAPAGRGHADGTTLSVGAGAEAASATLVVGSVPARSSITAELVGASAVVATAGLAIPAAGCRLDAEVAARHLAADGTSRQHHAAIVADGARSSFGGHVLVAPGTTGTDADQQARNLLLGPAARADARPWLEIYADDVACTHGATVGQLDDDALFYLRSRGISTRDAQRLLVHAFATDALDRLYPEGLTREWLRTIASDAIEVALDEPSSKSDEAAGQ